MSFTTRCPACSTMFKVVPDQLRVSMGWVRCGRCAEVFDAQAALQSDHVVTALMPGVSADAPLSLDDAGAPALASMSPGAPAPVSLPSSTSTSTPTSAALPGVKSSAASPRPIPRWIAGATQLASSPGVATEAPGLTGTLAVPELARGVGEDFDPAAWRDAQRRHQQSESGFANSMPAALGITRPASLDGVASVLAPTEPAPLHHEDVTDDEWNREAIPAASAAPAMHPDAQSTTFSNVSVAQVAAPPHPDAPAVPFEFAHTFGHTDSERAGLDEDLSFVRDARRNQRWQQLPVRRALAGAAVVLTLTLALQVVIARRDEIAALQPSATPLLQRLCDYTGCEIRPARQIEALVIDSSTFNKIGADAYRLSFVLKNNGRLALEVPALEVTLTDPQDQPLIRRVVIPAQFGAAGATGVSGASGITGARTLAARGELSGTLSMKIAGDLVAAGTTANLPVAGYRLIAFYP